MSLDSFKYFTASQLRSRQLAKSYSSHFALCRVQGVIGHLAKQLLIPNGDQRTLESANQSIDCSILHSMHSTLFKTTHFGQLVKIDA